MKQVRDLTEVDNEIRSSSVFFICPLLDNKKSPLPCQSVLKFNFYCLTQ